MSDPTAQIATEPPQPVLRTVGVSKRFGDVVANDRIDFDVRRGEVHCLLGENGAGKSTLISLLAGVQQPDDGTIEVNGRPRQLSSPAVSLAQGIGVVYQHSTLVPTMTALENLMLEGGRGLWLNRANALNRLTELSSALETRINPDTVVGDLGLGQQQQLEIAKVLWRNPTVLVLDEPTSLLTGEGIEDLKSRISAMKQAGVAIVLVTHKLEEALALADRVTVLRAGRVALRRDHTAADEQGREQDAAAILAAMFGDDLSAAAAHPHDLARARFDRIASATELLRLEGVSTRAQPGAIALNDVSFTLRAGEILGIAGVEGNGQRPLAEVIAGQLRTVSGRVLVDGRDVSGSPVKLRQRLGVRYVTDDRLNEGIVASMSVALNLVLKRIGDAPLWRFGHVNRRAFEREAQQLVAEYDIRTPTIDTRAGTLSGGNIQKILLARELSNGARVVVFNNPSHGLDAKTVLRTYDRIRRVAEGGGAVLLISTDLDELVALSSSVSVMSNGRLVGRVENHGTQIKERIGQLMVTGAAA